MMRPLRKEVSIKVWEGSRRWQTDSMVFVADDLGAWLVGLLADAGRRKLTSFVLGGDQERALRLAGAAAVQVTVSELCPKDAERADELTMIIRQVFAEPVPAEHLAEHETVLEALRAGVAGQLAVLDDADLTGTGRSSAAVLGVSGTVLAEKLTSHLLREIVGRAARGEPLAQLATQLNHDVTHLRLERLEGTVGRIAHVSGDLRHALAELDVARAAVPVAGQQMVVGDVPHEPPAYQLRNDLLADLDLGARTGHVSVICVLTGLRGVGKTQLAAAYARARIADRWRLVAWVHADDESAILSGLTAVATALSLDSTGLDEAGVAQAVRHRLEADGDRCVVVFDNANDPEALRPFLPAAGDAQVLITSTRRSMGHLGSHIQVGEFTTDQALAFLATRIGRLDVEGARTLAAELGCLPLALAQASAVIADQHSDYDTYLARLRHMPVEKMLGRVEAGQYPHGLASAILLSLESVQSDDETGVCAAITDLIAVLSPSGVPRSLLYAAGQCCGLRTTRQPAKPEEVDQALARLAGSSLLTFTGDGKRTGAHRLVTRVVRDRLAQEGRLAAVSQSAATVLDTLCMPVWQARQDRDAARDLVRQILALHEHSASAGIEDAENLTGSLLELRMWALTLMNNLGDNPAAAVAMGEPLLADAEKLLGDDHFKTLNTGNDLATAYRGAGRAGQAITLQERIAGTSGKVLGNEHPHTLGYSGNLANAYQDAGLTSAAISIHQQVLTDRERILGADHPDTLTTRSNLAASYQIAGRTSEAIALNKQVLTDRERLLGPDHPDTLGSRNNLANAYHEAGRISAALPLYERVITDHERILGTTHPATLTARINFSNAIMDAGRPAEALEQSQCLLADCEHVLGPAHPITLAARASLANAHRGEGQLNEAIELYEQTLVAQEQALGPEHPQTLISRGNLAVAYRLAGREEQGIRLLESTVTDQQGVLGPGHPDTLNSLNNLANAYQASGQHSRALALYKHVLADREQILGAQHPNTLISRGNLANVYALEGRLCEATALYESALSDCERILGASHPTTRAIRQNFNNAGKWERPKR
jgi:tetratricopeptide (TPR) repeat protein